MEEDQGAQTPFLWALNPQNPSHPSHPSHPTRPTTRLIPPKSLFFFLSHKSCHEITNIYKIVPPLSLDVAHVLGTTGSHLPLLSFRSPILASQVFLNQTGLHKGEARLNDCYCCCNEIFMNCRCIMDFIGSAFLLGVDKSIFSSFLRIVQSWDAYFGCGWSNKPNAKIMDTLQGTRRTAALPRAQMESSGRVWIRSVLGQRHCGIGFIGFIAGKYSVV